MIVYDYSNVPVEVNLPNKPVFAIFVRILSGDETGTVVFEDGTDMYFDASNHRIYSFFDGDYVVHKSKIQEWLAFAPSPGETASYERGRMNWEEEELNIPDCYDPIYQAERLATEEPALHCENCGKPIYDEYWDICGDLLCEDCAAMMYRKNVEDLTYD